jgi:hypothetical protein
VAIAAKPPFKGTPQNPVPRNGTNVFNCGGCDKVCTGKDYYMVRDHVWFVEAALPFHMIMCIDCLEVRIGRKLVEDDFSHCPLNIMNGHRKTIDPVSNTRIRTQTQRLAQASTDRPGDTIIALVEEAAMQMRTHHLPRKTVLQIFKDAAMLALAK